MKKYLTLSPERKITIVCLFVAVAGVLIQIISGHPYPKVPPVFFILLIPAVLIFYVPWPWIPIIAVLAGIFLTAGLFLSGASNRLIHLQNPGDSIGLWIQTAGVLGALILSCVAVYKTYHNRKKGKALLP